MGDELWVARFMLYRVAEENGIIASLDCKPIAGTMHSNIAALIMNIQAIGTAPVRIVISVLRPCEPKVASSECVPSAGVGSLAQGDRGGHREAVARARRAHCLLRPERRR
jgi:hypothetical protein